MIEKTRGVVLQVVPVSETSRVVSWMTSDFGKLATMVKGSQRPKSMFLGQYDLFYTCELLFYPRPRTGLHIARESSPLKRRDIFRRDWKRSALASYLVSLTSRTSQADAPQPRLFRLLDRTLDELARHPADARLVFWYELRLMKLHGLAPRLDACSACGGPIEARSRRLRFSDVRGGAVCARCAETERSAPALPPDLLAVMSAWQRAHQPDETRSIRCTARQLGLLQGLLGSFLQYHLETALPARKVAFDILRDVTAEAAA